MSRCRHTSHQASSTHTHAHSNVFQFHRVIHEVFSLLSSKGAMSISVLLEFMCVYLKKFVHVFAPKSTTHPVALQFMWTYRHAFVNMYVIYVSRNMCRWVCLNICGAVHYYPLSLMHFVFIFVVHVDYVVDIRIKTHAQIHHCNKNNNNNN